MDIEKKVECIIFISTHTQNKRKTDIRYDTISGTKNFGRDSKKRKKALILDSAIFFHSIQRQIFPENNIPSKKREEVQEPDDQKGKCKGKVPLSSQLKKMR
jgi:hypothetical protein